MLQLQGLKGRIARLEKLARGLAAELRLRKADAETLLLHRERKVYVSAIADALAGADLARDVLTKAVRRDLRCNHRTEVLPHAELRKSGRGARGC